MTVIGRVATLARRVGPKTFATVLAGGGAVVAGRSTLVRAQPARRRGNRRHRRHHFGRVPQRV
jgi:hypothetical protein